MKAVAMVLALLPGMARDGDTLRFIAGDGRVIDGVDGVYE